MSAGYTYTSISTDPGEPARISVSFYLDDRAWVRACGLDTDRPLLAVSLGEVSVSIAPVPGRASSEDARIARELASAASEYAAAVGQLAAGSSSGTTAA